LDWALVPGVGAVLLEDIRGSRDQLRSQDGFAAARAIDPWNRPPPPPPARARARWNRHAPCARWRDAPVRPVRHHVEDAIAPPRGNPLHLVIDCVARRLTKRPPLAIVARNRCLAVHSHEPLRRGQKDHGVVTTPAVGVLVRERLAMP